MDRFPIGFWSYIDLSKHPIDQVQVKDWEDAGMTVAMSPFYCVENPDHVRKMHQILDECQQRHIGVILSQVGAMYWHIGDSAEDEAKFRANVAQAVNEFGSHPAVIGLHCGDEPKKDQTENACKTVRIQKELAPHWQPFLNLLPWHQNIHPHTSDEHFPLYLDRIYNEGKPDFYAYDCYYHMNPGEEGWEIYFKNLEYYSAAARRHGITFWTTLLSCGHFNYRCPSQDDLQWQLGSALAWGVRGIMWFFLYQRDDGHSVLDNFRNPPINEFWQRTRTFDDLSYVNRHFLNSLAPALNILQFKRAYNIGLSWGWGGYPFNAKDRRVISATGPGPLIVSEFKHPDGADYVALTNNSCTNNVQATIAVRGLRPKLLQVGMQACEQAVRACDSGEDFTAATQWFAPGQMALYRVVDDKK